MIEKILTICKIILAVVIIVFGIWLSILFKVNIGELLSKLFNGKINPKPDPKDLNGLVIGKSYKIIENKNPFRDKTIVELENGVKVNLPDRIIDSEVEKVILVKPEVLHVVKKGSVDITDIFNTD